MTPEELHRRIEEYRDGTLSDADARELSEAIRQDPAVAEKVRRQISFSGHLGQAVDGADDASFARSFAERLQAEHGRAEFVRAFEKRSSVRPVVRTRRIAPPRTSWMPYLVAAGLALAVLGLVYYTANQEPPKPVAVQPPTPRPPVEEPKVAPEPMPLPPRPEPPKPAPETPKSVTPPVAPPKPDVVPTPPPAPVPAPHIDEPKPAPSKQTEVAPATAVAKIDRVEGDVHLLLDGERKPARTGTELQPGTAVGTGRGHASLLLPDGTRFGLGPDSLVREVARGPRGTRVTLSAGTLVADVAKQPADQSLVFVTPHAEAKVLGTVLRLVVDGSSTRLEVKEGKVRLSRDPKFVDVAAGQYAVAVAGQPLAARSMSPDEIVLYPQEAKLTGAEWSLQRDIKALTGVVLEAGQTSFKQADHVETRPSYATFTFYAAADKEYRIWMRLASQEKGDPWTRDIVTIEPLRVTMNQKSPFFGAAPTTAWVVTGVSTTPGFSWISSHGEPNPAPPLVVKFQESGIQSLRVYVVHPWVRVDAIWLSATQKTRPAVKQVPPPEK